jgi:NADH:ubiquinone oxidoreductase subunit H
MFSREQCFSIRGTFHFSFVWFVSCLAEPDHIPFDFTEVKCELVAEFNIGHGVGGFALIF